MVGDCSTVQLSIKVKRVLILITCTSPDHPGLLEALRGIGRAVTATSANLSGRPAILDPDDLDDLLSGRDAMVIDGGVLPGGPPSTLVGWKEGELEVLRRGSFPVDRLISFSASSVEISVEDA